MLFIIEEEVFFFFLFKVFFNINKNERMELS